MEDDARDLAQKRAEVLRPLLLLRSEDQVIGPAVESAAAQLDVSRSTAWRLLSLLRENDGRASALLPNRSGPKLGVDFHSEVTRGGCGRKVGLSWR